MVASYWEGRHQLLRQKPNTRETRCRQSSLSSFPTIVAPIYNNKIIMGTVRIKVWKVRKEIVASLHYSPHRTPKTASTTQAYNSDSRTSPLLLRREVPLYCRVTTQWWRARLGIKGRLPTCQCRQTFSNWRSSSILCNRDCSSNKIDLMRSYRTRFFYPNLILA